MFCLALSGGGSTLGQHPGLVQVVSISEPHEKGPLVRRLGKDAAAQSQAHLGTYLMAENTSTPREEKGL